MTNSKLKQDLERQAAAMVAMLLEARDNGIFPSDEDASDFLGNAHDRLIEELNDYEDEDDEDDYDDGLDDDWGRVDDEDDYDD